THRAYQKEQGGGVTEILLQDRKIVVVEVETPARVTSEKTYRAEVFLAAVFGPPFQFSPEFPFVPFRQDIRRTTPVLRYYRLEPFHIDGVLSSPSIINRPQENATNFHVAAAIVTATAGNCIIDVVDDIDIQARGKRHPIRSPDVVRRRWHARLPPKPSNF